jgi:hypothetical protein
MLFVQRSLCELQLKEGVGAESVEVRNQTQGEGVYTLSRSQNRTGNNSNNNPLTPTPTLDTLRQGLYASAIDACLVVNAANKYSMSTAILHPRRLRTDLFSRQFLQGWLTEHHAWPCPAGSSAAPFDDSPAGPLGCHIRLSQSGCRTELSCDTQQRLHLAMHC